MSSPPPSPYHDPNGFVDAITGDAPSHTPAPHVAAAGVAPSSPVATLKRNSSQERDGTVSGVSSPPSKRTDARPTPRRCIRFNLNMPTPMQIDEPDITELDVLPTAPTPSADGASAPSVTPSPHVAGSAVAEPEPKQTKTTSKPKKKSQKPKPLVLDSKLLTFVCGDVFDKTLLNDTLSGVLQSVPTRGTLFKY